MTHSRSGIGKTQAKPGTFCWTRKQEKFKMWMNGIISRGCRNHFGRIPTRQIWENLSYLSLLAFKPRTSHMLVGKHFTPVLRPQLLKQLFSMHLICHHRSLGFTCLISALCKLPGTYNLTQPHLLPFASSFLPAPGFPCWHCSGVSCPEPHMYKLQVQS